MERKIGEIFEYNGEWYQCVKGRSCNCCDLLENGICVSDFSLTGNCFSYPRKDKTNVLFKKLEKVGEPYDDCGTILQRFRIHTNVTNADTKGLELHIYSNNTIAIEIKQNKEDMEERELDPHMAKVIDEATQKLGKEIGRQIRENINKQRMKPFNLEEAKVGKPVCTRDGRKARIICWDRIDSTGCNLPIVALVQCEETEVLQLYHDNGKCDAKADLDLMMLPEKKERWVNVYKERCYESKEEAIRHIAPGTHYIDTIRVEWEE